MARVAWMAVLLLLAGCIDLAEVEGDDDAEGTPGPGSATSTTDPSLTSTSSSASSSSATPGPCGEIPGHCDMGSYVTVSIRVPQGGTVDVPLPHSNRCLPPSGWQVQGTHNATAALRTVERGQVYTVVAQPGGIVNLAIDKSPYPTCQTLRADPWSVDPDPEGELLPVNATVATALRVQVHDVSKYCYTDQDFEGTAGPGWTTLPKIDGMWVCQ